MAASWTDLRGSPSSDAGFTLIEVGMASILVVAFALAFASSFGVAFGTSRGNMLRQQATAVLNEELEYVRSLSWDELQMSSVDSTAPMLDDAGTTLVGSETGFSGNEVLAVYPGVGIVTPLRVYVVDGQQYSVYRYVSHSPGALRRVAVLIEWVDEGASETLLGSTLISEVTARANAGGVTTTTPAGPGPSTTTSVASSTTTSVTTTSTSTSTTTTMPRVVIEISLVLDVGSEQQSATVLVDYASGGNASGALVTGEWSTSPTETGYPFTTTQLTTGPGRAMFVHNDGHPATSTVMFCVTDVALDGYEYDGGTQCSTGVWG